MTLSDFTSPGLIIPTLTKQDVAGVIQELSQVMQAEGCVADVWPFYHAVLSREYLVSTEMQTGIALPHARLTDVGKLCFSFGRSETPLLWGGGVRSVRMVFLTAVPESDSMHYLLLISGLARLTKETGLIERLTGAVNSAEIFQVFREVPIKDNLPSDVKNTTERLGPKASFWSRRFLKR